MLPPRFWRFLIAGISDDFTILNALPTPVIAVLSGNIGVSFSHTLSRNYREILYHLSLT